MAFIDSAGVKLYVEETGKGHPIVFVHEYGSDFREWEQQVRYFSRAYRCIAYNARGYPPSDVPNNPALYGYELARDDIAAVMRGLAVDKAHIVGLSMGGYAALQFGLSYPEMASALVVAGAGSGSPPHLRKEWQERCAAIAEGLMEKGMEPYAKEMGQGPTRVQLLRKDPRAWREFMRHLREHSSIGMAHTMARYQRLRPSLEDFRDPLSKLDIPVLLLLGDEDEPCLETNLFLKRAIATAGLVVVPNTGHAVNLEEPAAFNAAIESFFAAAESKRWRGSKL